ncbi:14265_t:CDS:2 [Entrophospora sp. SA101]|nr:14265_t:CDS:2 [Entrophospora sp. SA101]
MSLRSNEQLIYDRSIGSCYPQTHINSQPLDIVDTQLIDTLLVVKHPQQTYINPQSLTKNINPQLLTNNINSQSTDNNINRGILNNSINSTSLDDNIIRQFFNEHPQQTHINPQLLIKNINSLSRDNNTNIPLLYNNQISYLPLFYMDPSIYNIDLNQSYSPHHTNSSINIHPQSWNNNQTSYFQQSEPISQLPNYPDLNTYPSNEQPVYMTLQPEYGVLKLNAPSITTNVQPKKDKKQRKKPRKEAQRTEPYTKRTHARIACKFCREKRLRCGEKKEGSSSCNRCIEENVQCIFDKNPGKRGRKLYSKNKPKENKTENLNLNGLINTLSTEIGQTQALVSDDGSGDDLQGGNHWQQSLLKGDTGYLYFTNPNL